MDNLYLYPLPLPTAVAEYCDERVCRCLSVCLCARVSLRERISGTKRPNFTDFLMRVTCTRYNHVLDVFIKKFPR